MSCVGRLSAPIALPGFAISAVSSIQAVECANFEACLGGNSSSCAPSYTGSRCARCVEETYRLDDACQPCGISSLIWIFGILGPCFAVITVVVVLWLEAGNQTRFLSAVPILSAMQIIGLMSHVKIPFHPIVSAYIKIAQIAQLNLDVMQHSCLFGEDEYAFYARIRFFFWLPFLLFGMLGLLGCLRHLLRSKMRASSMADPEASMSQLACFGCGLFNILYPLPPINLDVSTCWHAGLTRNPPARYSPIVSTSWLVFNCKPLGDGTARLEPAPHLDCYDSRWWEARIYATLSLVLWGVLFPVGLAVLLNYFRSRLRTADFSRKFSLLTFGYKRECTWWEVASDLKMFFISGCIVLFRLHPSLHSVLPLSLLFVYVGLTLWFWPFYNPVFSAALVLSEVSFAHIRMRIALQSTVCLFVCLFVCRSPRSWC